MHSRGSSKEARLSAHAHEDDDEEEEEKGEEDKGCEGEGEVGGQNMR